MFPKMFVSGKGMNLIDENGNQYLDCLSSAGALPLGHNHPIYKQALNDYINSENPQQMLDLMTPLKRDYILEIKQWFPQEMNDYKIQFCSPSGSDAVEAALKLVRIYSGRQNIISFSGAYHGQTLGALLCMGNKNVKNVLGLTNFNNHILPYPNKYHWFQENIDEDTMIDQSLKMFEQLITDDDSGVSLPAGVIVECVQGEGGSSVAPFRWIQGISNLCKKYKISLICDEVQSGWMRTGKPFAFNWSEIIPDVVVLSKAAGGGQPMAFITYDPKLDVWNTGSHTGTFRGNQLGMITGSKILNYLRTNQIDKNVIEMNEYLVDKFKKIQIKYPQIIAEIRGLGLMVGIQIGDGYNYNGSLAENIQKILFSKYNIIIERGGREGSVIRLLTSLEITKKNIDYITESIDKTIGEIYYFTIMG